MSMTRGRSQTIEVQTSPPGARVTIRPGGRGLESPATVSLRRKPEASTNTPQAGVAQGAAYVVTASLPGYKDASVPVESTFTGRTWARNVIWIHPAFLCIGVAVDVATGAAYELTPSNIFIEMEPVAGTKIAGE
jgi:hypothetical protein